MSGGVFRKMSWPVGGRGLLGVVVLVGAPARG